MINIEIIYSPGEGQPLILKQVALPASATVIDALHQAQWYEQYPETRSLKIGIFSRIVNEKTMLQSGDRIEIYRPLLMNPKEARRLRASR